MRRGSKKKEKMPPFLYRPELISSPSNAHQNALFWTSVFIQFEAAYVAVYMRGDGVKTKAHVDNCKEWSPHCIIHEPQLKWCSILFFDALVQMIAECNFSVKTQSCVDRRQFNQHQILLDCILENHDRMMREVAVPIITPDSDTDTRSLASLEPVCTTTRPCRFPACSETVKVGENVDGVVDSPLRDVVEDEDGSPPSKRRKLSQTAATSQKCRRDDTPFCAIDWRMVWGSFAALRTHLEGLSGTGRSAARHSAMAQLLVNKLADVPVARLGEGIVGSLPHSDRRATWEEVFAFVKRAVVASTSPAVGGTSHPSRAKRSMALASSPTLTANLHRGRVGRAHLLASPSSTTTTSRASSFAAPVASATASIVDDPHDREFQALASCCTWLGDTTFVPDFSDIVKTDTVTAAASSITA
jgi:hypothetical protein